MHIEDTPWKNPIGETEDYIVFRDKYPVTEGHVLFVPKENTQASIMKCYAGAYAQGRLWVAEEWCDAYNIGQNIGEAAGQTVMYPHVHLIPRRGGDMNDPRGGMRHVIPEKGNYKK